MNQRFVRKPTGTGDRHFVSQPTRQPGRYEHTLNVNNRASIRHFRALACHACEVTGIYVIDGLDIALYSSPEAASSDIEGYDAHDLEYVGVDGTVWKANVAGAKWGPVTLHPTDEQRPDLVARLRAAGYELDDTSAGST